MFLLEGLGLGGIVLLALWMYAIFDVISTPDGATRNLPKMMWLMLVLFLPDLGAIAWLLLGRPQHKSLVIGDGRTYGSREATNRELTNQTVSRSDELNSRLEDWEREQAAAAAAREKDTDQDRREADLERRENEAKARDLAAWEQRLQARENELGDK